MVPKYIHRLLLAGLVIIVLLLIYVLVIVINSVLPSSACKHPATGLVQSGISARVLVSGGSQRCYLLYVPSGYESARPVPVVFSLHAFASKPEGQEYVSRWDKVADAEHFVVVYPQGISLPLRWNSAPQANIEAVDDVQFMRDMIADVARIVSVDPARIYVTGFSNGGGMADRIACELADRVAAVGTVGGVYADASSGCNPARPISVISFHGTTDPFAKYNGGTVDPLAPAWLINVSSEPTHFLPVRTWIEGWAERNDCSMTPEAIPSVGGASGIRYTACRGNVEVVLYTIDRGGHTWPGGAPLPVSVFGKTSMDIDASATIWAFFKAHPLSSEL